MHACSEQNPVERGQAGLPCGDPIRMAQVLLRLEPRLTEMARRFVHNPDATADAVQNAFNAFDAFEGAPLLRAVPRPCTAFTPDAPHRRERGLLVDAPRGTAVTRANRPSASSRRRSRDQPAE
jgi:hypothetical protein